MKSLVVRVACELVFVVSQANEKLKVQFRAVDIQCKLLMELQI